MIRSRSYSLDWLRVLAMIGIFFFHNARFYDIFSDWHVRNATTALGPSLLVGFMSIWIMPLFFVIAGAGAFYALKSRNARQYAAERSLRLLVPLAFGMLTIVVPQAYFEALFRGYDFSGYNILQVYWLYLQTLPELNWFHLWFLAYLFVFSLVLIPIFVNPSGSGKSLVSRIAARFGRPAALYLLLVLSLAIVDIAVYPGGFWGDRNSAGGWNIVSYVLFFISGYLIFSNTRILEGLKKLAWWMLGAGVLAGALLVLFFLEQLTDLEGNYGTPAFIASQALQAANTWAWLFAILGLGSRFLDRDNRFLRYSNEAVLPFYILHQTVIIVFGFYVVRWSVGVGVKYLVISAASFAGIMLLYELFVRRINALRFLFGMKSSRPPRKPKELPVETG
ncbi:MAG: acyltransferase family protein [Chloroflexi bacterium]|nr:acyltransferase family protein [Chloroflexota bacterium]